MMNKKPLISVCIPTYNYANYVGDAIASVLNQTFQDFELIVIDDASDDNTDDVIHAFNDPRIIYYKNKKNIGLFSNFNKCLKYVRGIFVKYLCADDFLLPYALERMLDATKLTKNIGIVCSGFYILRNGIRKKYISPHEYSFVSSGIDIINRHFQKANIRFGYPSTILVRNTCFKQLGGFLEYPKSGWGSDIEMWLRILTSYNFAYQYEPLCVIRTHPHRMSQAVVTNETDIEDLYRVFRCGILGTKHYHKIKKSYLFLGLGRISIKASIKAIKKLKEFKFGEVFKLFMNIVKYDPYTVGFFWRLVNKFFFIFKR